MKGVYMVAVNALEDVVEYCSTSSEVGGTVFLEVRRRVYGISALVPDTSVRNVAAAKSTTISNTDNTTFHATRFARRFARRSWGWPTRPLE